MNYGKGQFYPIGVEFPTTSALPDPIYWEVTQICINRNGDQLTPNTSIKVQEGGLRLSDNYPILNDFVFAGYSLNRPPTDPLLQPGDEILINKDTVLYAVYDQELPTDVTVMLTRRLMNGQIAGPPQTITKVLPTGEFVLPEPDYWGFTDPMNDYTFEGYSFENPPKTYSSPGVTVEITPQTTALFLIYEPQPQMITFEIAETGESKGINYPIHSSITLPSATEIGLTVPEGKD